MTIDEAEKALEGGKAGALLAQTLALLNKGEFEGAADLLSTMADAAEQLGLALRRITPTLDVAAEEKEEGLLELGQMEGLAGDWFTLRTIWMERAIKLRLMTPKQIKTAKRNLAKKPV